MANSAATKNAFRAIRTVMMRRAVIVASSPSSSLGRARDDHRRDRPFSTASISTGAPRRSSSSPGSGTRPSRDVTSRRRCRPRSATRLDPEPARCSSGRTPGRRTRPSVRRSGRSRALLNSSATPPSSSPTHVLERDQADDRPARVHDQRLMAAPFAQERQQPIGRHRVRHAQDRPDQGASVHAGPSLHEAQ